MTGSKRSIKERIALIAKEPKLLTSAVISVVLVAFAAACCTFTGAKTVYNVEIVPLTAEEEEQYNKTFEPLLYDEQGNSTTPYQLDDRDSSPHCLVYVADCVATVILRFLICLCVNNYEHLARRTLIKSVLGSATKKPAK